MFQHPITFNLVSLYLQFGFVGAEFDQSNLMLDLKDVIIIFTDFIF